ncbi:MAG: hypothetical protein OEZ59_12220, partial [Deltaproteobacteria bacterium]|nr:hypothetical protein [Deltaproteobacteria bacterium]
MLFRISSVNPVLIGLYGLLMFLVTLGLTGCGGEAEKEKEVATPPAPGFITSETSITTTEGDVAVTFTILPQTDPGADTITLNISSGNPGEGTVSPASISWTTADYSTPKEVTVTPVRDFSIDSDITYDLQFDPSASTQAEYAALGQITLPVTNRNEMPVFQDDFDDGDVSDWINVGGHFLQAVPGGPGGTGYMAELSGGTGVHFTGFMKGIGFPIQPEYISFSIFATVFGQNGGMFILTDSITARMNWFMFNGGMMTPNGGSGPSYSPGIWYL